MGLSDGALVAGWREARHSRRWGFGATSPRLTAYEGAGSQSGKFDTMRRDVLVLREFYATALGRAARAIVARKLAEAWGQASGLDMMGLGYAAPYLGAF